MPHAFPSLTSPLPPSRPHPLGRSAPWRDSALRVPEKTTRSPPPAIGPRPSSASPSSSPGSPSSVLKPVASRPSCRAENGGSEAGRERPGFPAGAERRGLQTRRGQVHHARVSPGASPVGPVCARLLSLH